VVYIARRLFILVMMKSASRCPGLPLPPDHIILGDEAFSANSEQILTPVAGEQVPGSPEDTYNFFQSSLRMAIESESRARPNTLE
jgi:hypothetical protein